jgi:hypothetical protein
VVTFVACACSGAHGVPPRAAERTERVASVQRPPIDASADATVATDSATDGAPLSAAEVSRIVSSNDLMPHIRGRVVSYDIPSGIVAVHCSTDAQHTVDTWLRMRALQNTEPQCAPSRRGYIVCITTGRGANVVTALALIFRTSDGALVGGVSDFETQLADPLVIGKSIDSLFDKLSSPDSC